MCLGPEKSGKHLGCKPPCKADPATPWRHSGPAREWYGPGGYPKRPCMGVSNLRCFHNPNTCKKSHLVENGLHLGCKPPCKAESGTHWLTHGRLLLPPAFSRNSLINRMRTPSSSAGGGHSSGRCLNASRPFWHFQRTNDKLRLHTVGSRPSIDPESSVTKRSALDAIGVKTFCL